MTGITVKDIAFQIQQAAATKGDGDQAHDQGKGDETGDQEEKGFEKDADGVADPGTAPSGIGLFRAEILNVLTDLGAHLLAHVLKAFLHFGAHFAGAAFKRFHVAFHGVFDGLQINFFSAHFEFFGSGVCFRKDDP